MNAIPARNASRLHSRFLDSARELPESWPRDRVFLGRAYLQTLEECLSDQMDHRYAVLEENGRAVAGAIFQRIDFDHHSAFPGATGALVAGLARTIRISGVICGNTFASGPHGYWRNPRLDPAVFFEWLQVCLHRARTELAPPGRKTLAVLKDVAASDSEGMHLESSFERYDDHPIMSLVLDRRWQSFADYRARLRRSYCRELRIARSKLDGVVRRELSASDFARYDQRLDDLRDQVLARATAVPARKDARCLALLSERLQARCSVVGYFRGEELLAFNTRFADGADFESHYFGMDYEANGEHSLYRNMLYDDIETAIEGGFRRVLFGRCSHESKSAMGAQPETLASFVQHPSRLITKLVVSAARKIARTSWRERHPFKADTTQPEAGAGLETPAARR